MLGSLAATARRGRQGEAVACRRGEKCYLKSAGGQFLHQFANCVENFVGSIAKQMTGKVDLAKEDLIHVSWGSSGPPFRDLPNESKDGKGGRNSPKSTGQNSLTWQRP